jgi:hypothetical protein
LKLPDRARRFIDELRAFSNSVPLALFRRHARARLGLDEDLLPDPESESRLEDYILWSHRDESGRSVIDLVLEANGAKYSPEEIEVFRRFNESEFGVFRVTAVRRGLGLDLRRIGDDAEFEIVETVASEEATVGMGLIARLVPYRGHYELAGALAVFPPEAAYGIERSFRNGSRDAIAKLHDPISVHALLSDVERRPPAPEAENRLEAELFAEKTFAELGLDWRVADLQARMRSAESPLELLRDYPMPVFEDRRAAERLMTSFTALWNHTPRPELGERTPHQARADATKDAEIEAPPWLARDLLESTARRFDPSSYPDAASRRAALDALRDEWMKTPQPELDGLRPLDVIDRKGIPPLPPESELPQADRLLWDRAAIAALLRDAERRPRAAALAFRWAVRHDHIAELDSELIRSSLACIIAGERTPDAARSALRVACEAPNETRKDLARAIGSRLDDLGRAKRDVLPAALDLLTDAAPGEHLGTFLRCILADDHRVSRSAARGIAASTDREALAELADRLSAGEGSPVEVFALALAGEAEALRDALRKHVVLRGPSALEAMFDAATAASDEVLTLEHRVQWSLDTREDDDDFEKPLEERRRVFAPLSDVVAARAARDYFPSESVDEFVHSIDSGELQPAMELVVTAARRALHSVGERRNWKFTRAARAMAAVLDVIAETESFEIKDPTRKLRWIQRVATVLAWAIRGRSGSEEWEASKDDLDERIAILRIDLPILDVPRLREAARDLPTETLAELAESEDDDVAANAMSILGIQHPDRFLAATLGQAPTLGHVGAITRAVVAEHGDRALRPLVDWMRENEDDIESRDPFLDALAALGTERAALVARRTMKRGSWFCSGRPYPILVFQPVIDLGDRVLAKRLLDELASGVFDLGEESRHAVERDDLVEVVANLLELLDEENDAEARVDAAIELYRAEPRVRGEHESEEAGDLSPVESPSHGAKRRAAPPANTVVRSSSKIGRNDPCPCGSGKKFKKCCGKE